MVNVLVTVSEELEKHLKTIGIHIAISCLLKPALLGTFPGMGNPQLSRHFSRHVVVILLKKKKKKMTEKIKSNKKKRNV